MLSNQKQLLQANLEAQKLALRNAELQYYSNNNNIIAQSASLLAGFAFSALAQIEPRIPEAHLSKFNGDFDSFFIGLYYCSASMTFGFNIVVLFVTMFCNVYGPGLALRGPDGSMDSAVEGMLWYKNMSFFLFRCGLSFFLFSAILFALLWFNTGTAIACMTVLASASGSLFWFQRNISRRFAIPDDKIVTGAIDKYELAGLQANEFRPQTESQAQYTGKRSTSSPPAQSLPQLGPGVQISSDTSTMFNNSPGLGAFGSLLQQR